MGSFSAFALPLSLPSQCFAATSPTSPKSPNTTTTPRRPRHSPRRIRTPIQCATSEPADETQPPPPPETIPPVFLEDDIVPFWRTADVEATFAPISPDEAELLRQRIPKRIANLLLLFARKADDFRQSPKSSDNSFMARLLKDLPPEEPDWDAPENAEFRDYVYVTTNAPTPTRTATLMYDPTGSDSDQPPQDQTPVERPYVDENGEPIIRPEDPNRPEPTLVSLFVGQVDSVDEQVSRIGYGILAIVSLWLILKVFFAIVSFFLSFTFSFFAIFALSAGIFVLFFFIRF